MANSNFDNVQGQKNFRTHNDNNRSNFRGKYGGNRDNGGFRIRLSDNEMKAVKTIQETFQLKSTVAVLGFAVRSLSELIRDENVKDLIKKSAQNNKNSFEKDNKAEKKDINFNSAPNPFARPEKRQKLEENKNKSDSSDSINEK